ncbi:MAG: HAD family hydrolase [Treponema sp.]|nr:HAD family hydrolase [Treponema sp.]
MKDFDYIFFDLDGTLTDPAEGITNSFKHAFKCFGMESPDYKTLLTFIGPPLPVTFKDFCGFDDQKTAEAVVKYREYFADKGLFENKVYEGIPRLLEDLRSAGKRLAVATSKPEIYSLRIMEHFDLSKYFDFICGSNMDETRGNKAQVIAYALEKCGVSDKSKVLMVGDRHHDIDGAKLNGLKSCGVLFGYGNREELEEAGADYIVDSVQALGKFLLK